MIKGRIISLASDFITFSFNHFAPNYSALVTVVRRLARRSLGKGWFEVGRRARRSFSEGWFDAWPAVALAKVGSKFSLSTLPVPLPAATPPSHPGNQRWSGCQ